MICAPSPRTWCRLASASWWSLAGSGRSCFASCREADFLLVATARVYEELLRAAPHLRLVQHQGVGYDNIDVDACRRAGIPVALTPEGTTIGVAEHTLLLILALFRHLLTVDAAVRRGEWPVWSMRSRSVELAGKTVGLIGFGRIGREVARRARAFDTHDRLSRLRACAGRG